MFNNIAVDVFIGLVFIFLLYSLLATIVQEIIATRLAFRAKVLEKGILRMLEDGKTTTRLPYGDRILGLLHILGLADLIEGKTVAPWFYAHPLIKYLAEDNYYSKPAYLDAKNFSKVMIDLLKGFNRPESEIVQAIHDSISSGVVHKLPINLSTTSADDRNPAIKVLRSQNPTLPDSIQLAGETIAVNTNTALFLRSLWQDSGANVDTFRLKLEQWFDDTMERATGWYKRYTRSLLFLIGLVLAIAFNVDTIAIHRILSTDDVARQQLVEMAIQEKNKYETEVNRIRRGETLASDSLFRETFQIVKNDADAAGSVLGLGRPWRDSCKMCDTVITDAFTIEVASLTNKAGEESDTVESVIVRLKSFHIEKDTLSRSFRLDNRDSTIVNRRLLVINRNIIADSALLLTLPNVATTALQRKLHLKYRCETIRSKREANLGQPMNWIVPPNSPYQSGGWETLFGWLITALAITLGAPFWFDLLSRFIKIRGTGSKVGSSLTGTAEPTPASSAATSTASPVSVNINSNSGEEAVG